MLPAFSICRCLPHALIPADELRRQLGHAEPSRCGAPGRRPSPRIPANHWRPRPRGERVRAIKYTPPQHPSGGVGLFNVYPRGLDRPVALARASFRGGFLMQVGLASSASRHAARCLVTSTSAELNPGRRGGARRGERRRNPDSGGWPWRRLKLRWTGGEGLGWVGVVTRTAARVVPSPERGIGRMPSGLRKARKMGQLTRQQKPSITPARGPYVQPKTNNNRSLTKVFIHPSSELSGFSIHSYCSCWTFRLCAMTTI